jgi:serine/threonine protein kinase
MNSSGLTIQIQRGGGDPTQQLAEGAFGCIFSPPLQCKHKASKSTKKNRVGKLTDYGDIKNEILASKYLHQFSASSEYCILPELDTICAPDITDADIKESIKDCKIVEDHPDKKYFQFNVEYGGKTLKHTLLNITPSFDTVPFFTLMRQLLEIGAFFVVHGFIHNDIHGNNVVLSKEFRPRVIDFGRSYLYNKINSTLINELDADYNPNLGQISPETTAEHGTKDGISMSTILDDLSKKKPAFEWGEKLLGVSRKQQIAEFLRFWETSKSIQENNWPEVYRLYWPVQDSWAIGNNLLQILRRMNVSDTMTGHPEWVQKRGVVKQVLRGLLRASPKRRLDCMQALALYDPTNDLVSGSSGKAWLEKKA